jgi:hypothetical protein
MRNKLIHVLMVTLCFVSWPDARAVIPPPDGAYPNFTTAEGQNALSSLSTGVGNTALGWLSLRTVSTGSYNTAVGAGTLVANTADQNTAAGVAALLSNTTGAYNTATGAIALLSNVSGDFNSAFGQGALFSNTAGADNTASGAGALFRNTVGGGNTADGFQALNFNTSGTGNTAVGYQALQHNGIGGNNIALGAFAGSNLTVGDNNIDIGAFGSNGESGAIRIGTQGLHLDTYIAGISGNTIGSGIGVIIDNNGHLGTFVSSRRFKKQIRPMDNASEQLFSLKPVTFLYNDEIDPAGISQFGLVAEDVEKVNPDLIVRDKNGKAYSVRYEQVNAMLLNEFLKEHRTVEAQQKKIDEQEKTMGELKSTLAEQGKTFQSKLAQQQEQIELLTSGVRKLCDQLHLNEAATRVAAEK